MKLITVMMQDVRPEPGLEYIELRDVVDELLLGEREVAEALATSLLDVRDIGRRSSARPARRRS